MDRILFLLATLVITGCASNETRLELSPDDIVVFPNGTVFGGASAQQASELAKIMVNAHKKIQQKLQQKDLGIQKISQEQAAQKETAKQALSLLEKLSKQQGSGEITLFFKRGSASLPTNSLEYYRLIRFLDYLMRENHGRKVLLVSIGSSSGHKDDLNNVELSIARSRAPIDTVEQYLINTPHKIYEAYGLGDSANEHTKALTLKQEAMYQHVRIIAAFEETDLPLLPR